MLAQGSDHSRHAALHKQSRASLRLIAPGHPAQFRPAHEHEIGESHQLGQVFHADPRCRPARPVHNVSARAARDLHGLLRNERKRFAHIQRRRAVQDVAGELVRRLKQGRTAERVDHPTSRGVHRYNSLSSAPRRIHHEPSHVHSIFLKRLAQRPAILVGAHLAHEPRSHPDSGDAGRNVSCGPSRKQARFSFREYHLVGLRQSRNPDDQVHGARPKACDALVSPTALVAIALPTLPVHLQRPQLEYCKKRNARDHCAQRADEDDPVEPVHLVWSDESELPAGTEGS